MNKNNLIVIVDDEKEITSSYEILLKRKGHTNYKMYNSSVEFLTDLEKLKPAVIFLDIRMPEVNGERVLQEIVNRELESSVYIVSGTEDVETAVRCIKNGALDYIVKPIDKDRFYTNILKGLEFYTVKTQLSKMRDGVINGLQNTNPAFKKIVTNSFRMERILMYISSVAESDAPVLVTGETGTGKELIAEALHLCSSRNGRFIPVNVSALDENLFNDTLFGHKKGAFTGADKTRPGVLAEAENGTVFLDEIGDMSESSQVKLLRLLQNKEYLPVGADSPSYTNARIVAATNANLKDKVEEGKFRQDLYYRLSSHLITIPPLRERAEDIEILCNYFYSMIMDRQGIKITKQPKNLMNELKKHNFPGNVRELEAVIQDYVMLYKNDDVSPHEIRRFLQSHHIKISASSKNHNEQFRYEGNFPTLKEMEKLLVEEALKITEGNQSKAAILLGITRQAVNKRINN